MAMLTSAKSGWGLSPPESTYLELVRSLFVTLWPAITMAICFLSVGLTLFSQTHTVLVAAVVLLGTIAAVARVGVVWRYRVESTRDPLPMKVARKLERSFATAYLSFALIFGIFCAMVILTGPIAFDASVIALLLGYGAGSAAGLSLRPWISVPGVLLAAIPTIVVAWLRSGALDRELSLLIVVFTAGGIQSMLTRYRATAAQIAMVRSFAMLARRDYLTGLPNRLSLEEHFAEFDRVAGGVDIVAVHCLDLDRFKAVNDHFGHEAGDALLKVVADRLMSLIRECDFAARVGGDEFVVIQTQARQPEEVRALASRIVKVVGETYVINGQLIEIGTSVGYVISSPRCTELAELVASADLALCAVKRCGGGIKQYDAHEQNGKIVAA